MKNVIKKIACDLKESTKTQHEITKARHDTLVKSPSQAKDEFIARHKDALKSPKEKQQDELAMLKAKSNK